MSTPNSLLTLGFFVFFLSPIRCSAESSTCLTVYKKGGAPAVFRSPKCPRWNLFPDDNRRSQAVYNCQVAVHQGRRQSQEDRAVCALDVRIPFFGIA
ncbi:hypothetical protein ZOSMA_95G00010 [Zostera marina]|uniref:Secreted protein n=1 Tax=Zostera marina TaxID=29655 RepID=A0A0K9NIF8_ZOSMR|nr:hypothetical protein ZOSMA_95G00010 [Zostera marina]